MTGKPTHFDTFGLKRVFWGPNCGIDCFLVPKFEGISEIKKLFISNIHSTIYILTKSGASDALRSSEIHPISLEYKC